MIDLREIRLGNWFHHNENWCYRRGNTYNGVMLEGGEFDFKFEDRDWYAFGEGTLSSDNISPILITPEWLEKLGFVYDSVSWYKDGVNLGEFKDGIFYYPTSLSSLRGPKIEYIHQVQNLFFALTGKEL